jgi:hypothetical protein
MAIAKIQRGATTMAELDRGIEKLLADIEAEVEYLILVEMMKEAWEELRKEDQQKTFKGFACY